MTAFARVTEALREHDCRRDGANWQCPAHADRSPSLNVAKGDGRALVKCFAGCSTDDVLAALGLTMRDLFDDDDRPTQARSAVAEYDYTDESGTRLFQVVRFAPKEFRQRRPDATSADGWAWSVKDVRRVLYRLPAVIQAVHDGRRVWVVEGENDVHALEGVGEVATCNAAGAGKWRAGYAEALRGAEVVIVSDKDDAGRKHAEQVLASLRGVAASVRVVEARDGKDASDHLAAGHGVDDFVPTANGVDEVRNSDLGGFVPISQLADQEIRWWWPGRLAWGMVAVLAGDGGAGKSTLARDLEARMTTGQAPPGGIATRPRGVVHLTAEEHLGAVVRPGLRLMGADLDQVLVLDPEDEELAGLTLPSGLARVESACRAKDAGLLVIDTGPAFMDADLRSNSEEHIRRVLAPLARLAERLDLIAVVIAHLNKAVGVGAGQRIMGGAAWRNAPRLVLLVGAPPGQDMRETGDRIVAVEKTNLGAYPPAQAFQITPSPEDTSRAIIEWGQEVEGIRADDLVRPALSNDETSDREDACELLREALADGPRTGKEVEAEIVKRGISERTLRRARGGMGIAREAGTVYQEIGNGPWFWRLPEDHKTESESKPRNTSENPGGHGAVEGGHLASSDGGWPPGSSPLADRVLVGQQTPESHPGGHTPVAGHLGLSAPPAALRLELENWRDLPGPETDPERPFGASPAAPVAGRAS